MRNYKDKIRLFVILFSCFFASVSAQQFKVMLDAGHGGHDFGSSRGDFIEKHIVLAITNKVGAILSKDKSIKVMYTRDSDKFIELRGRSNMANDAKANIFVSIHANSHNTSSPNGTETYVMGLEKNKSNLEVAKKENEVIVLEKGYGKTYSGYNPNDPTSLLGLTLAQEQYLNQSIALAANVQVGFGKLNRGNRGVKQAPFLVLHGAFMPSILIEVGFLSNPEEGAYISSEKGQQELAEAIAEAIINFKNQFYSVGEQTTIQSTQKSSSNTNEKQSVKSDKKVLVVEGDLSDREVQKPEKNEKSSIELAEKEEVTQEGVIFKIQIAASNKKIAATPKNFKGLSDVSVNKESNMYKYYYKETTDINYARKALEEAKNKGYRDAYIVPFKNGVKTSLNRIKL